MAAVNIRRDVSDKFYRYKMPQLLVKVEGKGNGIKTVVPNMSDIAKALSRPPTYPTKFFGCELGAQTTFDDKGDRYIVNGAHNADRLRELLDVFIDKFVLCPNCKNPETDLCISRDEMITRDCKACGSRTNVDMRHKLTTFILKNPPAGGKGGKGGKKAAKKEAQAAAAAAANGDGRDSPGEEGGDPGNGGNGTPTEEKKPKEVIAGKEVFIPTVEQARAGKADEDWSVDTSKEAVQARMKSLEGNFNSSLVIGGGDDDDEGDDENSPYSQFGSWVKENRDDQSDVEIFRKAVEFGIEKKHKTLVVLMQVLFSDQAVAEIKNHGVLLKKLTTSEKHQKALLGGLERLVGVVHPDLLSGGAVPKLLMALYQNDILEEEVIKYWGTHVSKKYVEKDISKKVKRSAEPMLKWLDEAEESDSE